MEKRGALSVLLFIETPMYKLLTGTTLSLLVFTGGLASCDSTSFADNLPLPQTTSTPVAQAPKPSNSGAFTTLEQSTHAQVNQYRKSRNLPPLTLDARISEQARVHSQAMASGRVPFSHQGFEQRVSVIGRAIPYRASAENVAYNQGYDNPDQQAVQGWIKSQGHRINMEGQYDLTGIGVAKNAKGEYYFTQLFIKRR